MSDYTKVDISICKNGFVVNVPSTGESLIFPTGKKLQKWLEDNIAQTGQVNDFCEGLDSGTDKRKEPRAMTTDRSGYAYLDTLLINSAGEYHAQQLKTTIDK